MQLQVITSDSSSRRPTGDIRKESTFVPVDTSETDEQIIERMRDTFDILKELTQAVKNGHIRSLIISGAPGIGKSFGVEEVLSRYDLFNTLASRFKQYEIIKGDISPVVLYSKLYHFRDRESVLVFDDTDTLLYDSDCLGFFKAALDSSDKRTIHYLKNSRHLAAEGIPNSFDYKGGCIFITNLKFNYIKSKALQSHLAAIQSRSHYIDLRIDTVREQMLRIRQIVNDGMLDKFGFDEEAVQDVINFIDEHKHKLNEVSLRTVIKASELKVTMPKRWKHVASHSLMKKA